MSQLVHGRFTWAHVACKCGECEMPDHVKLNAIKHATELTDLEDILGVEFTITSWYRCKKHNQKEGGAKSSRHLEGDATDLKAEHWTGQEIYGAIEALIRSGVLEEGGLGIYANKPRICHYDSRGKRARWKE